MAVIKPFKAVIPDKKFAEVVACVPYDVPYESEVRAEISRNPHSFLRVTRPEAELAEGQPPDKKTLLDISRKNYLSFISEGKLIRQDQPSIFIYRLTDRGRSQTGIVACCSIDEYDNGLIKKHEKTRPDKVEDRTGHMLALGSQTGIIFLTYKNTDSIRQLIQTETQSEPLYDFTSHDDNVRQTVWLASDPNLFVASFREVPALYIADGHHRAESASLARKKLRETDLAWTPQSECNYVLAGIFPSEDLAILPYNRAVRDLAGLDAAEFLKLLQEDFAITETDKKSPDSPGQFAMYLDGKWHMLRFKKDLRKDAGPIEKLDVSILQDYLLSPILGISDPRTDSRIAFIGGRRGTDELERLVNSGEYRLAFSMYPTAIDDLINVADSGEVMPPKSTWFEPKLKDGLFIHEITHETGSTFRENQADLNLSAGS